jgi:hypothetical protein
LTAALKTRKIKINEFWNEYSDELICTNKSKTARVPQQFMKRVVDMGMGNQIFDEFLLYDYDEYPIDVNAVEIYNGRPETILDFVDSILNVPVRLENSEEDVLRELQEILVGDYGAKHASEL